MHSTAMESQNEVSPKPNANTQAYSEAVIQALMELPVDVLETALRVLKSTPSN